MNDSAIPSFEDMAVLVIEDSPEDMEFLQRQLRVLGVGQVDRAITARQAYSRLSERAYDCALVDQRLPDGTGTDLTQRARELSPDMAVVILTGDVGEKGADEALRLGAQDFLIKGDYDARILARCIRYSISRMRSETERNRLTSEVERTQRLESLGVLAGGVAHDFNNLLTGIVANAEFLQRELDGDGPLSDAARDICAAAEQASALCHQLLAYSGRGRLVVGDVWLRGVCNEAVRIARTTTYKQPQLDFPNGVDIVVEGDPSQLKQVLLNLLTNAAEATDDDGVIRLTVAIPNDSADVVTVTVSDDGSGIALEHRSRIFEPFFSTRFTGRGLGLAAVHGIVRSHGGDIRFQTQLGQGSTFICELPISRVERTSDSPPPPETKPASVVVPLNVLVVDDEDIVRRTCKRILLRAGHKVTLADGGNAGLSTFSRTPEDFDVVLVDMTMPDMSGEQLVRAIHAVRSGVRVVVMSGYSEHEIVDRFTGSGIMAAVTKPFQPKGLLEALQRAVG